MLTYDYILINLLSTNICMFESRFNQLILFIIRKYILIIIIYLANIQKEIHYLFTYIDLINYYHKYSDYAFLINY